MSNVASTDAVVTVLKRVKGQKRADYSRDHEHLDAADFFGEFLGGREDSWD